ncbi:MAG: hypothetical protein GX790_01020, partial [Syntrophomonadaceae bacterium]|nr:hypothetical protein [Syntrophomonadaceae bacterium]
VIIVTTLALMFIYGQYIDSTPAEKTVENFYKAYFNQDYETVAEYLSVFWSVQFLPQYQNLSPRELIQRRPDIEKDIATILGEIEKDITYPKELHIVINSKYTKEKENSAIVGYTFRENGEASGIEIAILIKESGVYRIYEVLSASQADIESITDENMNNLDANFKKLLEQN